MPEPIPFRSAQPRGTDASPSVGAPETPGRWAGRTLPATRLETHYGDRVVRCYAERPRSVWAMFAEALGARPEAQALVVGESRWTYAEAAGRIRALAAGLAGRGIRGGDRVVLFLSNRPEFYFAYFACQYLGAIAVPVSTREQRAGVYLTNALTGWESLGRHEHQLLLFPELMEERDAANKVKQEAPILVILGNPPYNGFAGMATAEERGLTDAYRLTTRAPAPQGQGLNDLYVRFFRMAERRIVEKTGKGIVCFISNYSWLDGLSFTGMRERYLEVFDKIWIDCLNGDKYKTGKLTPDGKLDPSVFSTEHNREGIQVGTAVALLARKEDHQPADSVSVAQFWGVEKRKQLAELAVNLDPRRHQTVRMNLALGLPFLARAVSADYTSWPLLVNLLPVSFPGVQTCRDDLLVDIDRERLIQRMTKYFDPNTSDVEVASLAACAAQDTARFDARAVRRQLVKRGFLPEGIVRYAYRPFDSRWLYWEPETKLLDEKRTEYVSQLSCSRAFLAGTQHQRKGFEAPYVVRRLAARHIIERGANFFPMSVRRSENLQLLDVRPDEEVRPNLSDFGEKYLLETGSAVDDLFHHVVGVQHSPNYGSENAGALRQDWPRIPLPNSKELLLASADLGRKVADLLDPETDVDGVTSGSVRPELKVVGVATRVDGLPLNEQAGDLAVTAGWGHAGKGGVTMPGKGKTVTRPWASEERAAIEQGSEALGLSAKEALAQLGDTAVDVYLNDVAFWRGVPSGVWSYTIGGYQVMKKWLSYREKPLLGRDLKREEMREVTSMARRIAAILLLQPQLDANYLAVKANTYEWKGRG